MSNVRGPIVRRRRDAVEAPCDTPPPEAGRRYAPPHPLLGIGFVFAVAMAIFWGAGTGSEGSVVERLAVAHLALCVLLFLGVHLLEHVEMRHVAAKLGIGGIRVTDKRSWAIAGVAIVPAALAFGGVVALGLTSPSIDTRLRLSPDAPATTTTWISVAAMLLLATLWHEGFFRGFVFRGLMRRHGFVLSASVTTLLSLLAVALQGWGGALPAAWWRALIFELPLSYGLSLAFWISGASLWSVVPVRLAVYASWWLLGLAWPMLGAALVLLLLPGVLSRAERSHAASAAPRESPAGVLRPQ